MVIKLEDLMEECGNCNGTGKDPQTAPSGGGGGTFGRRVLSGNETDECRVCEGTGRYQPTESGEAILKFLKLMKNRGRGV